MAKKFHRLLLPVDGIHVQQAWSVADAAALAALVVTAADVGKIAHQVDTNVFYVLESTGPTVWSTRAKGALRINTQVGVTYTLALADALDTLVLLNNAGAIALTIPLNATTAIPVGSAITLCQYGAGQVTIAGAGGVTLNVPVALQAKTRAQFSTVSLFKIATNEWLISGDLSL